MSTDYAKLKNAELEALLKQRSLPHTGKKADMVARLQEDDAKSTAAPAAGTAVESKEDEIDWDDDADNATTKPAEAAVAAGGQGQVGNPAAVPNQVAAEDPAQTSDLSAIVPPTTTATNGAGEGAATEEAKEEKPAVDFTAGLGVVSMEDEAEKRAARAKRWGIEEPTADDEAKKLQDRAARFGTTASTDGPKGLNEALPDKSQKRRREGGDEGRRGDFKRGGFRGGRGRFRNGRRGGPDPHPRGDKPALAREGGSTWLSAEDRAKAEARKAKFATAS